jgi:predicted nucleic acid-binding protein
VSVYADASLLVALFTTDLFTDRARAFLESQRPIIVVSDFAAAEFAAVVARRVRTREMGEGEARLSFASFDAWSPHRGPRAETTTTDVAAAEAVLRRLDLPLRAPDALNIAIAQRIHADLATFDVRMIDCARALGVAAVRV